MEHLEEVFFKPPDLTFELPLAEFPRNALEGYDRPNGELDESVNNLHNLVHSMLNGTSALSHSAANDPIFVVRLVVFEGF